MGKYINRTSVRTLRASASDKCNGLLEDGAIELVSTPKEFIPDQIVCVVDNGVFGAAGFMHSRGEFE